jgi:glycosyltransferase involved in cell wall biosynthesis
VSVVCPVHNDAERLPGLVEALKPVAARGAQVVIVDDGSTDATFDRTLVLVDGLPRFEVLRLEANSGVAVARNLALAHVVRPYVWFCDSDDVWETDILDRLLARAEATGADVVVAGARIDGPWLERPRLVDLAEREEMLSPERAVQLVLSGRLHGYLWNKLFRREHVQGLRFPAIRSQSDFPFVFDALTTASSVAWTPAVVYTHLLRQESLSQSRSTHENLAWCWRHVDTALRDSSAARRRDVDYFRVWFYVVAAARSVSLSPSSLAEKRAALEGIRRSARWRDLVLVWPRAPRIALHLTHLLIFGGRAAESRQLLDSLATRARRLLPGAR